MKKLHYLVIPLLIMLGGCARFNTTQKDVRYDDRTEVTTKATAWTLGTSKSALTNFKATQTDKTQGASVGTLNQDTASTNAVAALEAIGRIIDSVK
jgi:hypothetical protein